MKTEEKIQAQKGRSPYFFNFSLDMILIILSPVIALLLGIMISYTPWAIKNHILYGDEVSLASIGIRIFTMAHLVIVVVRSYLNPSIFEQFKSRLIIGPLLIFISVLLSPWFLVFCSILAIWWDVYHSSLQTFGIGRIYDLRAGNDPGVGRGLDWGINVLLYLGPVVSGFTFWDHLKQFGKFAGVGTPLFAKIPAFAMTYQKYATWSIIIFGSLYIAYYVWSYRRLQEEGYRISTQKMILLAATGLCSIYTWGFNSFGQAFFIMNFFHALQYFALIWWSEGKQMISTFNLKSFKWGGQATFLLLCSYAFAYGVWAVFWGESNNLDFCFLLTISIMHFWFDGFIWSVRKAAVS